MSQNDEAEPCGVCDNCQRMAQAQAEARTALQTSPAGPMPARLPATSPSQASSPQRPAAADGGKTRRAAGGTAKAAPVSPLTPPPLPAQHPR